MATVTVLKFPTVGGADDALVRVQGLQKQHLIKLHDAAIVSWPVGKKHPKTKQLVDLVGIGATSGMFWDASWLDLRNTPYLAWPLEPPLGALGGAFRDYGIDDDFIKNVRNHVTEGDIRTLFLMTSEAVMDRVVDAFKNVKFEIITTNLSKEQEEKLREAFGQD